MARYDVLIKETALTELASIASRQDLHAVVKRLRALGSDPRPPGCEKLKGSTGGVDHYRVRQGDFRIIYEVWDHSSTVLVFKIGNRKDVYRMRNVR